MARFASLALLCTLLLTSARAQPVPLDSLAHAMADSLGLPSLVVAISVDGERHIVGVGSVDETGAAPDGHTFYEIGSISKVLTGLALGDAVGRGEVTLETPIRDLLPDSAMVAQHDSGPIRLWHLTTHTSGLPSFPIEIQFAPGFNIADPYAHFDTALMFKALSMKRAGTPPGETMAYSNMGVGLLGHALGRTAGTTYTDLVTERVLGPLGMTETVAAMPDSLASRFPIGFDGQGERVEHWTFTDATMAAGGWRATAADLLTLGEAAIDPDSTSLGDAIALSLAPRHDLGDDRGIGLGWFYGPAPGSDLRMAQHSGGTGGFRSFLAVVPEARVVVVTFTNSDVGDGRLGAEVLRRLLLER